MQDTLDIQDDLSGFKADLEQLRGGGRSRSPNRVPPDHRGESASSLRSSTSSEPDGPALAAFKKAVYAVVAIAMFQAVVGPIPIPDGTVLVGAALAFLALGLWAGAQMNEEMAALAEQVEEWRG